MNLSRHSGDLSNIDFVDLLVVDLSGSPRSLSLPRAYMSEGRMEKGVGVDAASFGFQDPAASRLSAIPDLSSAFVEDKEGVRILHALCDLKDEKGRDFPQYPRAVAAQSFQCFENLAALEQALVGRFHFRGLHRGRGGAQARC